MRIVVALVVLVACGKKPAPAAKDGTLPPSDIAGSDVAIAPIDAAPVEPLAACTPTSGSNVSWQNIGSVKGSAVLATSPPFDGRLFVVEQSGLIYIFDHTGKLLPAPFLDLSANNNGPVVFGGEQGLLGLAFDPGYADNHQFYVDYTTDNPAGSGQPPFLDVVVRYTTSATDPYTADPASATPILSIPDFAVNHNAGMLEFGSDNDLYIATGDGGGHGDPHRNGQNPHALLGKILRIDVHHPGASAPYSIPADNPFADGSAGAPEVFVYGLRNPWRWSFDRGTGDMWIADVGQDSTEELDYLPAGQQAGANLGWSAYEANGCCATQADHCTQGSNFQACDPAGKTFPVATRSHATDKWEAIIGGQVYRGPCFPDLTGIYFFTDFAVRGLVEATVSAGIVTTRDVTGTFPPATSSIHADARGELYLTAVDGIVYHLVATP